VPRDHDHGEHGLDGEGGRGRYAGVG
jgi:hypothetical protein